MQTVRLVIYSVAQTITFLEIMLSEEFSPFSTQFRYYYTTQTVFAILSFLILIRSNPGNLQIVDECSQSTINDLSQSTTHNAYSVNKFHLQPNQICQICKITQSLRTFHCHQCKQCIPTYDHHCPYINKCIGQKNKPHFFLFILIQTIQSLHLLIQVIIILIQTGNKNNKLIALLSFSLILTFLMGSLLIFEIYCILFNITMQQFLYQNEIWYLKDIIRKHPFSEGLIRNLIHFFVYPFRKELTKWPNIDQTTPQIKINH